MSTKLVSASSLNIALKMLSPAIGWSLPSGVRTDVGGAGACPSDVKVTIAAALLVGRLEVRAGHCYAVERQQLLQLAIAIHPGEASLANDEGFLRPWPELGTIVEQCARVGWGVDTPSSRLELMSAMSQSPSGENETDVRPVAGQTRPRTQLLPCRRRTLPPWTSIPGRSTRPWGDRRASRPVRMFRWARHPDRPQSRCPRSG